MKEHLRLGFMLIAILILLIEVVEAAEESKRTLPVCEKFNLETATDRVQLPIQSLPSLLLVARSAEHRVEGKGVEYRSFQNFVRPKSQLVCGSHSVPGFSIQLVAPTVIDLTKEKKVGDGFWIFQMMSQGNQIGLWNQKSRLLSQEFNFEKWIKAEGHEVRYYQVDDNQYALLIKKKEGDYTHHFFIRYDATDKIDK